jgi:peptidoglycan/LPS O-acetylase OafA/YrhL
MKMAVHAMNALFRRMLSPSLDKAIASSWRGSITAGSSPHSTRVDYIDGLRGIAILMVMAYHYLPNAATYTFTSELGLAKMIMLYAPNLAWTGVDLFFVISGYLIGGILLRNREADNFFRVFYFRRFGRVLPVFSVWLGIMAVCIGAGITLQGLFNGHLPFLAHLTFTQNFAAASTGSFGSIWEVVTWSLAVEEQFYLALPLAVRLLPSRYLILVCALCIGAAPLIRVALFTLIDEPQMYVYTMFPARMDSLFLGVAIAAAMLDKKMSLHLRRNISALRTAFWFLAAVMASLLLMNLDKTDYSVATVGYTAIALFYASVVTLAALGTLPGQKFLRLLPLRLAGYWCFSLYLFHVPINYTIWSYWEISLGRPSNAQNMLVILFSITLSMIVSALLMHFVETPMIRLAGRLQYRKSPSGGEASVAASASPVEALTTRSPA